MTSPANRILTHYFSCGVGTRAETKSSVLQEFDSLSLYCTYVMPRRLFALLLMEIGETNKGICTIHKARIV